MNVRRSSQGNLTMEHVSYLDGAAWFPINEKRIGGVTRQIPIVWVSFEDCIHLFLDCSFSKEVWRCVVDKLGNIVDWNWKSIISCLKYWTA